MPLTEQEAAIIRGWAGQMERRVANAETQLNNVGNQAAVDQMTERWNREQDRARRRGYLGKELNDLEQYMVDEGIFNHSEAINRGVIQPTPGMRGLLGIEEDEYRALMNGDDNTFFSLSLPRAQGRK